MKPIISHVSLDKDFFSCFVLLVLKAGFPAHTRLVARVQAISVGSVTTIGHQQNPTVLNLQALDWPVRAVFVDLRLAVAKSVGI